MADTAALRQLKVARQRDALLGRGEVHDLLVATAVVVLRAAAGPAQQMRQAAQVRSGDEARCAQRLRARAAAA